MSLVLLAGTEKRSPLRLNSTRPRLSCAKMFHVARSKGGRSISRVTRCSSEPPPPPPPPPRPRGEAARGILSATRSSLRITEGTRKGDEHKETRKKKKKDPRTGRRPRLES